MTHRRYTIQWATGDTDTNLTQGEVLRIAAENDCEWVGADIVDKADGKRVGTVVRLDPH